MDHSIAHSRMARRGLLGAALAAPFLPRPAAAQGTPIVMKIGTATINDAQHQWMRLFAEEVQAKSGGAIKVELYPTSQLGSIPRMIEGTQFNSIQAFVGLALIAARLPGSAQRVVPSDGEAGARPTSAARAAVSAVVLATGTMLAVAGADPSRLSASLVAGTLGLSGLDTIDTARAAMFAIGITLLVAGAAVLLAGADRIGVAAQPAPFGGGPRGG